jgi:GNAT superfamily N-acetyltransferase
MSSRIRLRPALLTPRGDFPDYSEDDDTISDAVATIATINGAILADIGVVYESRNDEEARRYSHSREAIPWGVHVKWFQRTLADRPDSLWIGEFNGVAVGYARQDERANNRMLISVALLPRFRRQGLGVELIKAITSKILSNGRVPTARIFVANTVSAKAFLAAGFAPVEMSDRRVWVYEWKANGRKSSTVPSIPPTSRKRPKL